MIAIHGTVSPLRMLIQNAAGDAMNAIIAIVSLDVLKYFLLISSDQGTTVFLWRLAPYQVAALFEGNYL